MTTIDDFYHDTKAAVAGGTTMVIDFVVPRRGESLLATYNKWYAKAAPKVCCDYAFSAVVTCWNDTVCDEMTTLVREKGVNSFKFYMAYKDDLMVHDDEMFAGFQHCRNIGALARVHVESGNVIAEVLTLNGSS